MMDHLPECECYGRDHDECALCICDRLLACEQRVRLEDDDYAYVAAQAEADGRWRGWSEALDAARAAVLSLVPPYLLDEPHVYDVNTEDALAVIDALREGTK